MKNIKTLGIIIVMISMITIIFTGCGEEKKAAVAAYNSECSRIEAEQATLENSISDSQALIDSKEKPYDNSTIPALETAITDAKASIVEIPKKEGNAEKINALVNDRLKKISYTKTNETLLSVKSELEDSIKIMKQVTNPSEAFVVDRIKDIDTITGYSAVTEDNDPNGNLNKVGGYTTAIYFASNQIKEKDKLWLDGTIIENGTDGGGCIEVYATEDDAIKRRDYLATFDGTRTASGTHTVVGTVLVRTSNCLTASQQKELEKKIIDNLTQLR